MQYAPHVALIGAEYLTPRQPNMANAFRDFSFSRYVRHQTGQAGTQRRMIDNFSILLSHGLLLLAFWLLSRRADLDVEAPPERDQEPQGFGMQRRKPAAARENGTADA
jgi:hypothetical protein